MIQNLYAIKDVKAGFKAPAVMENDAIAMRGFEQLCKEPGTEVHTFLTDMELWKVGMYDTITGKLETIEPVYLMGGKDVLQQNENKTDYSE